MNKLTYKKPKEEIKAGEKPEEIVSAGKILDRIFKDPLVKHGLKEFQGINIPKEIQLDLITVSNTNFLRRKNEY